MILSGAFLYFAYTVWKKKISEINTAFIELSVENTQKAAYILSDKMNLNHFKIMDDSQIRIYEVSASTQRITKYTASLEDYFLKLTGEVRKLC